MAALIAQAPSGSTQEALRFENDAMDKAYS
jgi:hypothetical protein